MEAYAVSRVVRSSRSFAKPKHHVALVSKIRILTFSISGLFFAYSSSLQNVKLDVTGAPRLGYGWLKAFDATRI